jgi:hypothetical protein
MMLMQHRFERKSMMLYHNSFYKALSIKEFHTFLDKANEEYITFECHDGTKYIIYANAVEMC